MEPESKSESHLSVSVESRRRNTLISDDYSIHKTNEDATECKNVAVKLGYWGDPYISKFSAHSGFQSDSMGFHRDPEISRGYWARVTAVRMLLHKFIQKTGPHCQIVNLGCGFDTLYWLLKDWKAEFSNYFEVDFSSVTSKKIRFIRQPGQPNLLLRIADNPNEVNEVDHADLHAKNYHLLGADLRQIDELNQKLQKAGVDWTIPTVILCECVLIYMTSEQSADLIKYIADSFKNVAFINYEQVNLDDKFGTIMQQNLHTRGISLAGSLVCQNLESQKNRFIETGWNVLNWRMDRIYREYLPKNELQRIETIEPLDERELLTQLLEHYCIVLAIKDGDNIGLDSIRF